MHLSPDLYALVLEGRLSPRAFIEAAHRHLLETCPSCRLEWESVGDQGHGPTLASSFVSSSRPPIEVEALPGDDRHLSAADYLRRRRLLATIRGELRKARDDLYQLRKLPRERWPGRVARAKSRFRSRALADLLVEAARTSLATDPREAEALARLVPEVLFRVSQTEDQPWVPLLTSQARALRAQALFAIGEREAAERESTELREALEREGGR